jgi:hypothetical protein
MRLSILLSEYILVYNTRHIHIVVVSFCVAN